MSRTSDHILAISWRSVLLVEENVVLGENHRPVTGHGQTLSHIVALTEIRTQSICPVVMSHDYVKKTRILN
jgi:hypothetical protein